MKQKILSLIVGLVVAASAGAVALIPVAQAGDTVCAPVGDADQEIVTNTTTNIRLQNVHLVCTAACGINIRKHSGGTNYHSFGLGAAGEENFDMTKYNARGKAGYLLAAGLYYDVVTASSNTTRATVCYEK